MKKVIGSMAVVAFIALSAIYAEAATREDAKAMVEKAYSYLKANGKDKAFAEVDNTGGQFVKGDLYVFVQDFNGICLANGGNPKFVGMNHMELKDPEGKYFMKDLVELAKTKGSGWVDYVWVNPVTKKIQPKTTYVKRIEGMDAFIGCGVFK
jgi:cytochrome c